MAVDTAEVRANTVDDDDARRPLMTAGNIAWMLTTAPDGVGSGVANRRS